MMESFDFLNQIVGERLTAITFVLDYYQFLPETHERQGKPLPYEAKMDAKSS